MYRGLLRGCRHRCCAPHRVTGTSSRTRHSDAWQQPQPQPTRRGPAGTSAAAAQQHGGMAADANTFSALADLKIEDSPASSPTAAAATSAGTDKAAGGKQSIKKISEPLVWIDLEMTGLDCGKDTIIEIACLVTDGSLQRVIEGPDLAIHQSEEVLANMNDWCKEHHAKSGLVQRVRDSTVSMREAEQQVLAFVQEHTEYQTAQLAGNSVHIDRLFLQRWMPELLEHLHYRIMDVSSLKECCRRWKPKLFRKAPRKVGAHTAMSDIKESLAELRYYKQALFKGS